MDNIGAWGSYYRENPQKLAKDYLNITLKTYQKIFIYEIIHMINFMGICSRGIGKTWVVALACVILSILFPGIKIVIVSGVKAQAIEIITKIENDFLKNYGWGSQNLRNEISYISSSPNNANVEFYCGSSIVIAASNDNSRHFRANVVVIDEFRIVDPTIINTVIKKFLTVPRMPGYLKLPEYKDRPELLERNKQIYISSAWYKNHWAYKKAISFFGNMLDDTKKYCYIGLPYQVAIREGLLSREQCEDEMSEADFDAVAWSMEMDSLFYGQTNGAFFDYDDLTSRRKIKTTLLPLFMYDKRGIHVPDLAQNERRIMSVDVALMASKKHNNDAASLFINTAIPNDNYYMSNYTYIENFEGLTTDELGLKIMRYFYNYKCTDLVLDTSGNGIGVFDFIIKDQYDPETGVTYGALTSINSSEMADRCKVKTALKCVWCIKASLEFNSNMANSLRAAFKNGTINIPINEYELDEIIKKIPGYASLNVKEQTEVLAPYVQTTMLINEMINLEHELLNNKVKLKERPGMRKDRYTSIAYNNAVVQILNNELKPNNENAEQIIQKLIIRRGKFRDKII